MTATAKPHRHRSRLPYAAALVAVATLGACTGGDPGPSTKTPPANSSTSSATSAATTTSSSAPSSTTSVDPAIAKIPSKARPNSQEAAEGFALFYMDQVNEAFTRPDPSALNELSEPGCKPCNAFQGGARDLANAGHHHEGPSITPDGARANAFSKSRAVVAIYVTQHSVRVVDSSGKKVDQTKAGTGTFIATMIYRDHWRIEQLQVAK